MKFYTRQFTINDWSILKQIRLEALTLHPNYFDPSTDEFKMTDDEWKARLDNKDSASFGLYNDKNEIIGLTGIYRDKKDPKVAWMVSSFIKPDYRRQGLTSYLYEARIQWAIDQKEIETLGLYHRSDNEISRKSHQNFKFEFVNEYEPVEWPNGEIKSFVEYRLNLKTFRKTP